MQPWLPGTGAPQTTLADRAPVVADRAFDCALYGGAAYNAAAAALVLNGSSYAGTSFLQPVSSLSGRFTVVTSATPAVVAGTSVIWELGAASDGSAVRLGVEDGLYVLRYGPPWQPLVFVGPKATAGVRQSLTVRCAAWRTLCTLQP